VYLLLKLNGAFGTVLLIYNTYDVKRRLYMIRNALEEEWDNVCYLVRYNYVGSRITAGAMISRNMVVTITAGAIIRRNTVVTITAGHLYGEKR